MPAYDVQCVGCGALFEARASIAEADAGKFGACPECKKTAARRIFGATTNIQAGKAKLPLKDVSFNPKSGGGCCSGGGCGCR